MARPFLTARWEQLVLANYAVPEGVLAARVPVGCELEKFEGSAFVSLVAFDFLGTRVAGVKWPGFVNFPEINLRFYVRQRSESGERRGVCFVREFVPSRLIAGIARGIYNEPYLARPMTSVTERADGRISVAHRIKTCGQEFRISCSADESTSLPAAGSREHWFKEHQWGFGMTRRGRALVYEVRHAEWEVYDEPVLHLDWDFGTIYGEAFAFLNSREPESLVFAVGSGIEVYPKGTMAAEM